MVQKSFERKLIAILSADACGYSRLISSDEEARAEGDEVMRLNPKFSTSRFMQSNTLHDPVRDNRYKDLLQRALFPK